MLILTLRWRFLYVNEDEDDNEYEDQDDNEDEDDDGRHLWVPRHCQLQLWSAGSQNRLGLNRKYMIFSFFFNLHFHSFFEWIFWSIKLQTDLFVEELWNYIESVICSFTS